MSITEAINFYSKTQKILNGIPSIEAPVTFKNQSLLQGKETAQHILEKMQQLNLLSSNAICQNITSRLTFQQSFDCWMRSKVICIFQESFLNVLKNTSDTILYPELLKNVPWHDFCIEVKDSSNRFKGYFVSIEESTEGLNMMVTIYQSTNEDSFRISHCTFFPINRNKSLQNLLKENFEKTDKESFSHITEEMAKVFSAVYYLAAENAEIKPVRLGSSNTFRTKDNKILKTKNYNVGFRVGASIEQMYRQKEESASSLTIETPASTPVVANLVSTGKCTHIRRAHWHHFWIGKRNGTEERKLVVRWLAPTIVNGQTKEMDIVSHQAT